jgi:hypothetical protein
MNQLADQNMGRSEKLRFAMRAKDLAFYASVKLIQPDVPLP